MIGKSKKIVYCSMLAAGLGVFADQVNIDAVESVSNKSELVSHKKTTIKHLIALYNHVYMRVGSEFTM